MRVVCEKCQAVYAIEASLIPPRGARGQCPRCGHQQRVMPEGQPPSAPAPASRLRTTGEMRPVPPPAAPPVGTRPAPPPAISPFETGLPPPPAIPPVGGRPSPTPPIGARPSPATPALGARPSPPPAIPPVTPSAADRCPRCGNAFTDPFDKALGVCDSCRQKEAGIAPEPAPAPASPPVEAPPVAAPPAPAPPGPAAFQAPRPADDTLDQFFEEAVTQAKELADRAPATGSPSVVVSLESPVPPPSPTPSGGSRLTVSGSRPAVILPSSTSISAARRRSRPGWVLPAAALGLLLLAGGAAFVFRAQWMPPPPAGPAPLPDAIEHVLPRWRLAFVDVSGTAEEYLAAGNAKLAEDSPAAFAEAEEAFQKALSLDPTSDDAVAGYVQAVALARGTQMDDVTFREALALIEAAEARSRGKVTVWLAHANLLLTRDSREHTLEARTLVERALAAARPQEKPLALVTLGRTYVSTSAQLAIQKFTEALEAEPPPKRALYYRGIAHEVAGEYREAIDDFKARLALDPGQPEAVAALARLYEEVGEIGEARALYLKALEKNPDDLWSAMTLAALTYQMEGKPKEAVAQLRALLKNAGRAPQEIQAQAWVHLAAAERLAGNLDAATAAAEQALKLPGATRAAHLQLLLLGLQRRRPDLAAPHLPPLTTGKHLPPALVKLLEGRLLFAQGRDGEAEVAFGEAVRLDPRHLDALLYGGVAAVRYGHREDGFRALAQAMHADPSRLSPRPALTLYFLQPNDTLDGAEGHLLKLARDPNDVMPVLSEAIVRFHQRDLAAADKLLRQALDLDAGNSLAHIYRVLVAVRRGDKATAMVEGQRAVATGRSLALSHYAQGEALALDGQFAAAQKALFHARELTPSLLVADYRLAELEARSREAEAMQSARARLVRVTGLDPSYLPAKRALYALDR